MLRRKMNGAVRVMLLFTIVLLSVCSCVNRDDFESLKSDLSKLQDSLNVIKGDAAKLEDSLAVIKDQHKPIYIEFDVENSEVTASEGDILTVNYTLTGAVTENTVVTASTDGFYKVKVNKTSTTQGVISIVCPEVYTDGYINVLVSDGKGYSDIKVINICRRIMEFPKGLEYKVSGAGGRVIIPISTNFRYSVKVSTSDESGDVSWITINGADTKATIREESVTFQVAENSDWRPRSATISFVPENGSELPFMEIKINQKSAAKYTFTVNGVAFDMVLVEEGIVEMVEKEGPFGSLEPNEVETVQKVLLTDYYIGATEVTQELWKAVMGRNPSSNKKTNTPVESVAWYDCMKFTEKLQEMSGMEFRLPTEAQWEFAARGGNKSMGYTYSGSNTLDEVAWYKDNSGGKTHEVATKAPNELGIYDMSGNVAEWCYDFFGWYASPFITLEEAPIYTDHIRDETQCDDYNGNTPEDPNPEMPQYCWDRCLRGGSYGQVAKYLQAIYMGRFDPQSSYYRNGLRLALPLYPTPLPPTPSITDVPFI